MGYGLGKNSPVVLSLGKGNFEALIDRHGQWIRWRVARKCPCTTEENRAHLQCPKCGGIGEIYDYQREYEDIYRATVRNNIVLIPEEYEDAEILEAYDAYGRKFEFSRLDDFIQIFGAKVHDNELIDVRVRIPLVKTRESVTLEKLRGGYYRVPGILTEPSKLEGVYYQAAGDVFGAEGLKDPDGKPVNIMGYRLDTILTDSQAEFLTAESIKYVMPFLFNVLSQDLTEGDLAFMNAHNGDAVCTFPYMFDVSEDDILTILSGSMTHKIAMEKEDGPEDTLPEFFVHQTSTIQTNSAVYVDGTDYVLSGTNRIHWIGNQPEAGEIMSVVYRYLPTYRVAKNVPMLRTSENQRIPRKVPLKLYADFSEPARVNQND